MVTTPSHRDSAMRFRARSSRTRSGRRPVALRVCRLEAREVPASLSGRVFLDYDNSGTFNGPDVGIPGVTITLTSTWGEAIVRTTTTDAQGNYRFDNLASSMYTVTETQPGAPASGLGRSIVGTGGSPVIVDATFQPPPGYGLGVPGDNQVSSIYLSSPSPIPPELEGIITRIGGSGEGTGFNFTEVPLVSTGGSVFEDANNNEVKDPDEPGIAGVAVTLTGTKIVIGSFVPRTAITDGSGAYTFGNLLPGTYTITETQPGAYFDGPEQNGTPTATVGPDRFAKIDLTAVAASGEFNFGEVKPGTLSGVVFSDTDTDGTQAPAGEPGIPGVKIVLTGHDSTGKAVRRTTTTGTDGTYTFINLAAGTYAVREVQPAGYADGIDSAGTLQGTAGNDRIIGIHFTAGATATGYTFADRAVADLSLVQAPGSAVVNPGGTVTITYTVRNRGSAAAAATGVRMNYGGLTFVSASNPTSFSPATKTWAVGELAPGATQTLRITFRMPASGGTFVTTAKATTTTTQLSPRNDTSVSSISGVPALTRLWMLSRFYV